MKRELSIQDYRSIDLTLFAVMLIIFEFLITHASGKWFPAQPYTVSLAAAITAIVYMRWGVWGAFMAAISGFVFVFSYSGTLDQFLIYIGGNLLSVLAVLILKVAGSETIRKDALLSMLFGAAVLLLMQTGRALVSAVFSASIGDMLRFYTTDSLSMVFTLVIIWIVRRLDGVFENQKHYLIRLHEHDNEHDVFGQM